jgi:O-antigen/teichoic acid export membrane protein
MNFIKKLATTFIGIGSNAIYQVALLSLISKYYSMDVLGVYAFFFSISTVLFFLTNLGFRQLIVTSSKYNSLEQYFRVRFWASIVTSAFVCIIAMFTYADYIFLAFLVSFIKVIESLSEIGYAHFQQNQNHIYQSALLFVKSVLSCFIAVISILCGYSLVVILAIVLITHLLFLLFYEYQKVFRQRDDFRLFSLLTLNRADIQMVRFAFPLGVGLFLINLNLNSSRIISGTLLSEADTAVLAACLQLSLSLAPVVTGMCQVLLPKFTTLFKTGQIRLFKVNYLKITFLFLLLSSSICIFANFYGEFLLRVIYNDDISKHNLIFLLCLLGAVFNYAAAIATAALTSMEKYALQTKVMIVCILVSAVFMFTFVGRYGLIALVVSFLFSSFIRLVALYYFSFIELVDVKADDSR